jgi:hypothetical protein
MKTMMINVPDESDCSFSVRCIYEHAEIRGMCMASGDDKYDEECALKIESDLRAGNEWAWCTIEVECRWGAFTGKDFLGCCSYESEEGFKTGGYFEDMKREAYIQMMVAIRSLEVSV